MVTYLLHRAASIYAELYPSCLQVRNPQPALLDIRLFVAMAGVAEQSLRENDKNTHSAANIKRPGQWYKVQIQRRGQLRTDYPAFVAFMCQVSHTAGCEHYSHGMGRLGNDIAGESLIFGRSKSPFPLLWAVHRYLIRSLVKLLAHMHLGA